jgi:putative membrane protein
MPRWIHPATMLGYTRGMGMYGYYGAPLGGMIWMLVAWIIQLFLAYLVYQDAKQRDVNPVLWGILVAIPVIGWLFLVIYVIIRETTRPVQVSGQSSARTILDERFARGEIGAEDYRKMKEELNR